ncbi:sensor histidine kinase [Candidatus Magnetominusculus xianensis]|nr:HAMP domain-containing sensor histidine kinase [Candidatus Magnetominusculus xianensis]
MRGMLRGLWIKLFVLLLGVSVISLSSAFILRELMARDFRELAEGQMEDRVYWVIADLERTYEQHGFWKEEVIAEDIVWALMLGLEVRVLDRKGASVMDTGKALGMLSPRIRKRIVAISNLSAAKKTEGFLPYPLFLGGKELGTLEVRFLSPERDFIFIDRSNRFLLLSLVGIGGLVFLLSMVFSRRLTRPIKQLAATAETISEGDLKNNVSVSQKDEIGSLAASFNKMIRSLQTQESLRKRLISNIAHEIRTPLTAMKGELAGMLDGLLHRDTEQLQSLYHEVSRIEDILEDIEELSRAQAGAIFLRKRREKLNPILQDIRKTFDRFFIDKGVKIKVFCGDDLMVYADPGKLRQIVVNLLSNAQNATDKGGSVGIRALKEQEGVAIAVEDTGHGIPQEDLPFIFERFFHSAEGGLGIGLAIVKELVDAHNGRIEVKSECGRGTTMTVHIPDEKSS